MFLFTLLALAAIILSLAFFMLATAKIPIAMSCRRQKFTRFLLFGILWTTVLSLSCHASYTLRSFTNGSSYDLLHFRVYPTVPLTYFYSWRDNFDFWKTPLIKSYYTIPASLSAGIRTTYVLSLSLAALLSVLLLLTSFNRCAKVAALLSILINFTSLPFILIYMLLPQANLDMSENSVTLWSYFLEQFISYLTVILLAGLELRGMKTFSQLHQAQKASLDTRQFRALPAP